MSFPRVCFMLRAAQLEHRKTLSLLIFPSPTAYKRVMGGISGPVRLKNQEATLNEEDIMPR